LAKFEKRLSKLYEQLSKSKNISKSKYSRYKNTFTTTVLLKKIELYVWRIGQKANCVQKTVIKDCIAIIPKNFFNLLWMPVHLLAPPAPPYLLTNRLGVNLLLNPLSSHRHHIHPG
jgi:hypothetical protein